MNCMTGSRTYGFVGRKPEGTLSFQGAYDPTISVGKNTREPRSGVPIEMRMTAATMAKLHIEPPCSALCSGAASVIGVLLVTSRQRRDEAPQVPRRQESEQSLPSLAGSGCPVARAFRRIISAPDEVRPARSQVGQTLLNALRFAGLGAV